MICKEHLQISNWKSKFYQIPKHLRHFQLDSLASNFLLWKRFKNDFNIRRYKQKTKLTNFYLSIKKISGWEMFQRCQVGLAIPDLFGIPGFRDCKLPIPGFSGMEKIFFVCILLSSFSRKIKFLLYLKKISNTKKQLINIIFIEGIIIFNTYLNQIRKYHDLYWI